MTERADPGQAPEFATTRWTWVEAAGAADSERAREALAALCQAYWYPLYAFVRRAGVAPADAEDVVQDFFARLIEKRDLASMTRGHGRFRSFLRVAVRNHLANLRDRERALKRGGGRLRLPIDAQRASERFHEEPATADTPERAFDRAWALDVLEEGLAGLATEYESTGRADTWRELSAYLAPGAAGSLASAAERLGTTDVALRVALHRLRSRFRDRLRAAIARTVSSAAEVEEEIAALFRALS